MPTIGTTRRHTVAVGDATVSYAVDGAGPGVVLVHGAGGSADTAWAHLVDGFASDRTVVRPDYAGSGETRDHGGRLELDELVAQVAAAAEDAGAQPFDSSGSPWAPPSPHRWRLSGQIRSARWCYSEGSPRRQPTPARRSSSRSGAACSTPIATRWHGWGSSPA